MKYLKTLLIVSVILAMTGAAGLGAAGNEAGVFAKEFLPVLKNAKAYSVEMAELMPEEFYSFKPVPEIMSFGEQIVHTAGVTYWFMSKITGEPGPGRGFKAEGKSKAEIIKFLKESFDHVEKVLSGYSDKDDTVKIHLWGDHHATKKQIFLFNRDHITHHRGSMVIYLRLKGIKPAEYRGL